MLMKGISHEPFIRPFIISIHNTVTDYHAKQERIQHLPWEALLNVENAYSLQTEKCDFVTRPFTTKRRRLLERNV